MISKQFNHIPTSTKVALKRGKYSVSLPWCGTVRKEKGMELWRFLVSVYDVQEVQK